MSLFPQHLGNNLLPLLRAPLPAESAAHCSYRGLSSSSATVTAAATAEADAGDEKEESSKGAPPKKSEKGEEMAPGMFFDLFGRMYVLVRVDTEDRPVSSMDLPVDFLGCMIPDTRLPTHTCCPRARPTPG